MKMESNRGKLKKNRIEIKLPIYLILNSFYSFITWKNTFYHVWFLGYESDKIGIFWKNDNLDLRISQLSYTS